MRSGCNAVTNGKGHGRAGHVGAVLLATILPLSAAAGVGLAPGQIAVTSAAPASPAQFGAPSAPGAAIAIPAPGLLPAPDVDTAVTTPRPLSATADIAVPPAGSATPWRLAGMEAKLPPGASWRPRFLQIVADAIADPVFLGVLALGFSLLLVALVIRTRHRRRIGWGVLPDRSLPTRRDKR